jgi:hypothetical protein
MTRDNGQRRRRIEFGLKLRKTFGDAKQLGAVLAVTRYELSVTGQCCAVGEPSMNALVWLPRMFTLESGRKFNTLDEIDL